MASGFHDSSSTALLVLPRLAELRSRLVAVLGPPHFVNAARSGAGLWERRTKNNFFAENLNNDLVCPIKEDSDKLSD